MKHAQLKFDEEFRVALGNARSQGAVMVLQPGTSTGGPDNRHRGADQWLYVCAGRGVAIVDGLETQLESGTLILIEAGEAHEIRSAGDEPLKTLNIYVPPAYDSEGEELPAGRG